MQPILAALLLLCCALTASASAESDSWDFLQAVGGISVEAPLHSASGWSLPVHANVSGLERVTTKPTTLNSALVCEQTIAKVEGQSIYLTIVPALAHANFSHVARPRSWATSQQVVTVFSIGVRKSSRISCVTFQLGRAECRRSGGSRPSAVLAHFSPLQPLTGS